jgi:hypothetical protein
MGRIWRKSRASANNGSGCVEWAVDTVGVVVRDSKHRAGPRLSFPRTAWAAFLARLD